MAVSIFSTHLEQVADTPRSETWLCGCAVDSEGLATARLAVREDAHVVSVHCALYQVLGVLVHLVLTAGRVEHLRGSEVRDTGRVTRRSSQTCSMITRTK